ncbi:oligosaccharide flippase family protein [Aquimarina sp. ERC-38]|uniref:oligosaccharide flippase family protein n=1 Tax=Aquimarina sp. ERC-38 TaxID=2949996 RepID=UPI0022485108|nr:oligosaccharide flippase family protein [Aquimarina sp. ERC-38]UZO81859.1 oligosaccharide flippase family protein [Aquimarina sp. ERC-38]
MLEKFKINPNYFGILKNFSYLSLFQILNLFVPLIIYPYLINQLGKENYGIVIYAQAITAFFAVIVNFGFNITGTKDVSIYRNNIRKLSQIVCTILLIKAVLFLISIILLLIFIHTIIDTREQDLLFLFSIYVAVNEFLFPLWYFQGVEKMKFISIINFITKFLSIILIFLFIHSSKDGTTLQFIFFITSILGGAISLFIIFYVDKIRLILLPRNEIIILIKKSFYVFVSKGCFLFTESISKIIIEKNFGTADLAVYDLGIRIMAILKKPFLILTQAVYPNLSSTKDMTFSKKILIRSIITSFILYGIIILLSNQISLFFLSEENSLLNLTILIMGLSVPLTAITWGLGENMLVVMGFYKEYNISTILQMITFFICILIYYTVYNSISFNFILVLYILPILSEVVYRYKSVKSFKLI